MLLLEKEKEEIGEKRNNTKRERMDKRMDKREKIS